MFNGIGTHMGNLSWLSDAQSRSISPENPDGAVGSGGMATEGTGKIHARDLGRGWKISPSVKILSGETITIADIAGMGAIQQIWMTTLGNARLRDMILRIYWDGQAHPSVEVPLGDFFANGWGSFAQVSSLAICTNPARGYNSYWEMPFRKRAHITLENRDERDCIVYYQVNYALTEIPQECAYFHAQFRRSNPLAPMQDHVILDAVAGKGHYVGTYIAWGVNFNGWWGEGEIKFFLDEDKEFPTICGTGTEDYFGGAYNWDLASTGDHPEPIYAKSVTPYAGLHDIIKPDGVYKANMRFGMYRWHICDPIRFQKRIKVTIQSLGWTSDKDPTTRRYHMRQDDIASTSFWYQTLPSAPPFPLQPREVLEVI